MISVLKKANKAERGRVNTASTLGEVIRMGEPPTRRRGEERPAQSGTYRQEGNWCGRRLVSTKEIDQHAES